MAHKEAQFLNRELSWLEFNQRVLEEARNAAVPALERLKFLAITSSNLDEFFMVRVGGLHLLIEQDIAKRDPAGLTPQAQLAAITRRVRAMVADQGATFLAQLEPLLARSGLARLTSAEISAADRARLAQRFETEISAVITPMAVDAATPFPLLRNLGLNLAVRLNPEGLGRETRFAVIPLGAVLDRFVSLPADTGFRYLLVEDVVKLFAERLFPGQRVVECVTFRITRNADMGIEEDGVADLLAEMEEVLDARKVSACVRLEIEAGASAPLLDFLRCALGVGERETYAVSGPLVLSSFMKLAAIEGFDSLKYRPWPPQTPPGLEAGESMFEAIARHDIVLCHPYDSFDPVLRLIQEAADDPDVLAIKQTLYRTSRDSPVIDALRRATQRGTQVTALVELKARFDEARNIERARQLEQEGAQVIYGVKGLKTHSKVCIIVRREPRGIVRYLHFGTGNYNEITARLYSDISLLTCDEELGADAAAFLNAITGYSAPTGFRKLGVAPIGLREQLLALIDSETQRCRQGQHALIMAKMNSLVDTRLISALYRASRAGVHVRLSVRGVCCLRPGVKDLSENITVLSVIDRFLEHSRVFYFSHGGQERVYISSADWMPRNLDRRVELLVPVEDGNCRKRLVTFLETSFKDNVKGRQLLGDGTYVRVSPGRRGKPVRSQEALYRQACRAVALPRKGRPTVFEPHRPPQLD